MFLPKLSENYEIETQMDEIRVKISSLISFYNFDFFGTIFTL